MAARASAGAPAPFTTKKNKHRCQLFGARTRRNGFTADLSVFVAHLPVHDCLLCRQWRISLLGTRITEAGSGQHDPPVPHHRLDEWLDSLPSTATVRPVASSEASPPGMDLYWCPIPPRRQLLLMAGHFSPTWGMARNVWVMAPFVRNQLKMKNPACSGQAGFSGEKRSWFDLEN